MINLRYHIVSIVAVFLALAVGIFAGSTLLDRTILDGLEARQDSLDRRNDELKGIIDDYEAALDAANDSMAQFADAGGDLLDDSVLTGTSVLIIATRGIDEGAVNQVDSIIRRVGGDPLGTLWVGPSADLTDESTVTEMSAEWWGTDRPPAGVDEVEALTASMASVFSDAASRSGIRDAAEGAGSSEISSTTTEAGGGTGDADPAPSTGSGTGDGSDQMPDGVTEGVERFRRLVESGHMEWEPSSGADGEAFELPTGGLVVIVLTGEGSEMGPVRFVYPVVDTLAAQRVPVVVGEVHVERSTVDRVNDDGAQPRGYVVDRFHQRAETADVVTSVDSVDRPFGRIAVVMAMPRRSPAPRWRLRIRRPRRRGLPQRLMSDLDRSTRSMSLLTIASRLSGFVRIAVFASVFGKTYLANTYQSANSIPNVLFELFAAGALQAVLVPAMTRLGTVSAPTTHPTSPDTVAGRRDDTTSLRPYGHTDHGLAPDEYVAGAVLGLLSALLAAVTVGAIAAGPQLMGLLVGDVPDAATRQAEIELGAIFLWFFMPQVLFYGANIVATSVLNAKNSFLVPVAAPLANNVIVVIAYLWFGAVHEGPLTLDLTSQELWILAGGTTLGVIVFCSLPLVALARRGFRLRPRIDLGHPVIRSLVRDGAWAALFLGATQILLLVVLRVANRDPGGTVIYSFAFVLFMLPHSLFSVPIMTTRFPALSRSSVLNDSASFASTTRGGIRAILYTSLFASALSIAVARPATEVVSFGEAVSLSAQIAEATSFFAPGILGFGLLLFLTRVYYARSDARDACSHELRRGGGHLGRHALRRHPTRTAPSHQRSRCGVRGRASRRSAPVVRRDVPGACRVGRSAVVRRARCGSGGGRLRRRGHRGIRGGERGGLVEPADRGDLDAGGGGRRGVGLHRGPGGGRWPPPDRRLADLRGRHPSRPHGGDVSGRRSVLEVLGPSSGGIRRHVATLARHLPDAGWQADVVAPPEVMSGLNCGGADVGILPVPTRVRPLAVASSARSLRRFQESADVVHAHGLKAGMVALAARRAAPVVLTLHNVVLDEVAGRMAGMLERIEAQIIARSDAVIAVSPEIAERFAGVRRDSPISVILPASEPPVAHESRAEVRSRHGVPENAPLVVVVARLHAQKALDVFVSAFAELHRSNPAARGLIIGDGPQRAEVERWVVDAGVGGSLVVAGPSSHAVDEIAAADLVALSSVWEGAPLVVAEAMQLGRPVVSTDVGAVPEMVGSGGIIVPVGDSEALADAMRRVLADPGLAADLGGVALSRGRDLYGTEPLVANVAEVYSEVRRG